MALEIDHLERERFSPLGEAPIVVLERDELSRASAYRGAQAIIVGIDSEGAPPQLEAEDFDVLLSAAADAPRPWVSAPRARLEDLRARLVCEVRARPHAACALRQVLRAGAQLPFEQALALESFAYSTLLGGDEFRAWRASHASSASTPPAGEMVRIERQDDLITLTLAQPQTRNAMSAPMRDALFEALANALDDPSRPEIVLRGEGACFSVGGDLDEFGSNPDLAMAHAIRTMRNIAALIHELGPRMRIVFHGACIGSGLEAPAAAARRIAREGAFFQLPELRMGLIPGAGGTVTVARAIGRHRALAMMLAGNRVSAATALEWGLVHEVQPRP